MEGAIKEKYTFGKQEKLCSKTEIDNLFASGESFIAYPLRVVYTLEDIADNAPHNPKILISVSKKKFKRAVKRNRVKRLVREAYRLNKSLFTTLFYPQKKNINIAFIYLKDELPDYNEIEKAILKSYKVLEDKIIAK